MAASSEATGELLFCGSTDWATMNRKSTAAKKPAGSAAKAKQDLAEKERAERAAKYPNMVSPTRIPSMRDVDIKTIATGCDACHCIAIDKEGRVYSWGRNEDGQLGHGDFLTRNVPTIIRAFKDKKVVAAATGRRHSLVVTSDGSCYAFGSNKHGQLGLGTLRKTVSETPTQVPLEGITNVACGGEFSLFLNKEGKLYSCGLPQYGQLGHGSDFCHFSEDGRKTLVYEPQPSAAAISALAGKKVVKMACGTNHSVVLDDQGHVYTWGFGGYGRLGHKEQKDEWVPKQVEVFSGRNVCPADAVIGAGGAVSCAAGAGHQLYVWGKVKPSSDCIMYPKPMLEISGWHLRHLSCGKTTWACCAEESAITWGQASSGELGYGPRGPKSCANPDKVQALEGCLTHCVTAGNGFTLFVVDKRDKNKAALDKLPEWVPPVEVEETLDDEDEAAPSAGGKRKGAPAAAAKKGPAKKAATETKAAGKAAAKAAPAKAAGKKK
eukprot:jgi/Mesvir1/16841/Mv15734-RA.1